MQITNKEQQTLMRCLQTVLRDSSRSSLKKLLSHQRILINNKPSSRLDTTLYPGDHITVLPKQNSLLYGIALVYSDADIVVINKPSGLLSVPTPESPYRHASYAVANFFSNTTTYVVHRLDYGTSGLMLFAKTKNACQKLLAMFEQHTIERSYMGILCGLPRQKKGTWDWPLLEVQKGWMSVSPAGKNAVTHYAVLKEKNGRCQTCFTLETGRKNQIRAHAAHAKLPLLGDKKYGYAGPHKKLSLHAYKLRFVHPVSGKKMQFSIPLTKDVCL